jgi:oxaloacetate decarboxylase beta subunit
MALVPIIQPPIMKVLTTEKERVIKMEQLREVSQDEKVIFPIAVTLFTILLLPSAASLIGMLMLGNLLKESGKVPLLVNAIKDSLMYIVSIFLGVTVGATATADRFLHPRTLMIVGLGLAAFSIGTAGGVLLGKLMCFLTKGKINPLIGAAGVSAVPMAARVVQKEGQKYNPSNFLLMHAMGPNVAGVIGSAVAAGLLLNFFG